LLSLSSLGRGGSHRAPQDGGVGSWQHGPASCSRRGTEALPLALVSQEAGCQEGVVPASEREPGRDSRTGMGERASPPLSSSREGARRPHHGDVNEPRDADGGPGEGSLPSLTVHRSPVGLRHVKNAGGRRAVARKAPTALESTRSEIGLNGWQSALVFRASGALPPTLENLGEVAPAHWASRLGGSGVFPPARTHNRIRSPR